MSRIAIIPARGGSKRIPDKNIIPFCGKPMMAHVLGAVRESGLFEEIHVSTDSARIAEVADDAGCPVAFMRAAELCDDHTPLMPVLKWVLEQYLAQGRRFDTTCLALPCAPLIEAADLIRGAQVFEQGGGQHPVLAVAEFPVPVEWAFRREEAGLLTPREPGMFAVRSQDLQPMYYDTGTFSLFPTARILSDDPPRDEGFMSVVLPAHKAVDIDDPVQLVHAEILYLGRRTLAECG